jgi:formate dehydrogenase major subunit
VLKRHFARYTPEMVERVCGRAAGAVPRGRARLDVNSGRERTTALVYSVGWTQHSVGVQYIRAGAILQLLLGNMGPPRRRHHGASCHASIQGSTDIPTLFNILPGYLPMPTRRSTPAWRSGSGAVKHPGAKGFWTTRAPTASTC